MNAIYTEDAEKGVLGSILCDPATMDEAVAVLDEDAFFVPAHKIVWTMMLAMQGSGDAIEPVALQHNLVESGVIGDVGPATVAELYTFVPVATNIGWYINQVRDKWVMRVLRRVAGEIAQSVDDGGDVPELLANAESSIMKVGDMAQAGDDKCVHSVVAIKRAIDAIEEANKNAQAGKFITGVPTGFSDLDEMTSGWQPQQLVVVAARPGIGILTSPFWSQSRRRVSQTCFTYHGSLQIVESKRPESSLTKLILDDTLRVTRVNS